MKADTRNERLQAFFEAAVTHLDFLKLNQADAVEEFKVGIQAEVA
jgi:hypothetical protein